MDGDCFLLAISRKTSVPYERNNIQSIHSALLVVIDSSTQGSNHIDWNERFQCLLETPITTPEEKRERIKKIGDLNIKFVESAIPNVEKMICEMVLPESQKTLTQVSVGGVAGGDKFLVDGIFFKVSINYES